MHIATIIIICAGVLIGIGMTVAFIGSAFYLWSIQ